MDTDNEEQEGLTGTMEKSETVWLLQPILLVDLS